MLVDARDMKCPRPVVLALGALPKLAAGESLEVLVNEGVAASNLRRLADEKDCAVELADHGDHQSVILTPRGDVSAASDSPEEEVATLCDVAPSAPGGVIAIGSDAMGRGDEELGRTLMGGLIYALAHQEPAPRTMLFYNGGARLTCEGSASLEDIRELASQGTEILTCGTCLDFYGIKDRLAVGGVTNLYHIAEVLAAQPGVTSL